ncbi:hypothetical protein EG832_18535, partial [bacterium]|nr:hypothetical protein [bacterium]
LYGGVTPEHRRLIKDAFNDPTSSLRILIATEVAAEGLNLQNSCRYVIHQEIPWNPMRLEQRNGRVDRHGQSRNVYVFHFVSDQVEELKFLDFIVKKVDTARKDLGSIGKILDEAVFEYFSKGKIDANIIDDRVEKTHKFSDEEGDLSQAMHGSETEYSDALREFDETQKCLEFNEERLARLLNEAMKLEGGSLKSLGEGIYRIEKTPPRWTKLIEKTILLDMDGVSGAHPKLVFSPEKVQELVNGKMMFHPRKDTRLLMLGHPLMQKSLSSFRRRLWLNPIESNLRKWTVEEADLPKNISCIFCLYFDIGLRNQLGERFSTGILEVPVKIGDSLKMLTQEDWDAVKRLERIPVPASEDYWKNVMELVRINWYSMKTFAVKEK